MRRLLAALLAACLLMAGLPAARAEQRVIRLSFAGDCTLGGHEDWMSYSIGTFKVMAEEQGDYGYFLKHAREIFAQDDLTMVNLEGVLADSAKGRNLDKKWQFRGATDYVNILTLGSVEAVTLGNNHSEDFGRTGLQSTTDTLDAAGIGWCKDEDVYIYEKDGVRLAFLGFWQTGFTRARKWLPERIRQLKQEEGCAAVIINYHGGQQYRQRHNRQQEDDLRFAIDSGADLVIGHHPHALQGIEVYKGRSIVYSLGNFCYGGNRKPRAVEYPSMILGVELRFDGTQYLGQQLTIHPWRISGTAPRNNYQPLPATPEQAAEVMGIIQADSDFELMPYVAGQGAVQAFVPAE
ncbi:MAG: CapA family protein [Clostridiales bacterium]|nr:CapA family protein [Clostridiales bacterium]